MTGYIKVFIIFIGILVSCQFCSCAKDAGPGIVISGSSTMEPLIRNAVAAYNKQKRMKFFINADGSANGISSLISGTCAIAVSSIKIPHEQALEAQKRNSSLKEFLIAYDIIVAIVHPSNSISNLFSGQFADIYTGLIRDWKDTGGSAGKILVVERDGSSGTRMTMQDRFIESKDFVEGRIILATGVDVMSYIATHQNSIGYVSMSVYTKKAKALMINGCKAMQENVRKGYYPLYRELYVYINEKGYQGEIKSFIDFLVSKQGQDIIQKSGFVPVALMQAYKK